MALSDRTKSILLQVAYKGVVEAGTGDASLKDAVVEQFNMLVDLHTELGLNPDEDGKPKRQSRSAKVESAAEDSAPRITLDDGVEYFDYRGQKEIGAQKPGYPDFKLATNKQKSFWILYQGEPTEFAIKNNLA